MFHVLYTTYPHHHIISPLKTAFTTTKGIGRWRAEAFMPVDQKARCMSHPPKGFFSLYWIIPISLWKQHSLVPVSSSGKQTRSPPWPILPPKKIPPRTLLWLSLVTTPFPNSSDYRRISPFPRVHTSTCSDPCWFCQYCTLQMPSPTEDSLSTGNIFSPGFPWHLIFLFLLLLFPTAVASSQSSTQTIKCWCT